MDLSDLHLLHGIPIGTYDVHFCLLPAKHYALPSRGLIPLRVPWGPLDSMSYSGVMISLFTSDAGYSLAVLKKFRCSLQNRYP
jgi:hypothetical protein